METQAAHLVHESLRLLAIVLTAGIVLGWMSKRLRVPDIVLYLLGGMLLGPAGLGVIDLSPGSGINQFVFTFGAAVILFHGGLSTELPVLRRVWITVILLVTAGVLVTALVVAGAASMALGLSLINALLVGAVIASTDPAALIPIFQKVRVKPELAQTVVAESAFNDAVGAMLVTVLLSVVAGGTFSLSSAFGGFVRLAGLGLAVGAAIGLAAAFLMGSRSRYVIEDYESVMAIAAVLGSYLLAERVGGSGFMAVFVSGLMIGNAGLFGMEYKPAGWDRLLHFVDHLGLKMRMLIFLLLGSQVDLAQIRAYGWRAVFVVAVFMVLARPLAVLVSAIPDRRAKWRIHDVAFLMWTRETGVIPAALAGMIAGQGLEVAPVVSAVTFLAILFTLLIQATSTPWAAAALHVLDDRRKV